jgi:hypothetical protein
MSAKVEVLPEKGQYECEWGPESRCDPEIDGAKGSNSFDMALFPDHAGFSCGNVAAVSRGRYCNPRSE